MKWTRLITSKRHPVIRFLLCFSFCGFFAPHWSPLMLSVSWVVTSTVLISFTISETPSPTSRRHLVLISKVLQNIANRGTFDQQVMLEVNSWRSYWAERKLHGFFKWVHSREVCCCGQVFWWGKFPMTWQTELCCRCCVELLSVVWPCQFL